MVEKFVMPGRNVVDLAGYRRGRGIAAANAIVPSARACRHCGAWLAEDETDDDCSSAMAPIGAPRLREMMRRFVAE